MHHVNKEINALPYLEGWRIKVMTIMKRIEKTFSWHEIQSSHRLMILIVAVLGVLNFFWGEKVPAGGGFGWDGVNYANMVRNLDSMISEGQLSNYFAQRILPSAVVRSILLLSGASMTDTNIISGFELYNMVLLVGACWVWKRIAESFSLSLAGRWMGFSGIFINYQCSKQAFYMPVLTDVTALFIAMLLLLFYVEKKPFFLLLTTVIGSFCWPTVSVCGGLLLLFLGSSELPKEVITPVSSTFTIKSRSLPNLARTGFLVVLVVAIIGYIALELFWPWSRFGGDGLEILAQPRIVRRLKGFLTALPSLFGLLIALIMLVGSGAFFKALFAGLWRVRLSLVILLLAAVVIPIYIIKVIYNPGIANANSLRGIVKSIILTDEYRQGKILLPVVSLAVFWGPVVLLLILYWKAFCVEARKLGPGFVAVVGISLPLGAVSEPRFITIAWPFLVLGIVLAFETSKTSASFKYALIILTIVFAQFWMKLNLAPWLTPDYEDLFKFPKQIVLMHYGWLMNWWSYSIQLAVIILSVIWLRKTVIKVGVTE